MTNPASRGRRSASGRSQRIELLSVELNEECYVRFLTALRQLGTHYFKAAGDKKARSHPCYGANCQKPDHSHPYISKWYAAVLCWDAEHKDWREWVLEVTEGLELNLRGEHLPGSEWFITRSGESGARSPVSGTKLGDVDADSLGKPCDVEQFLKHFYRKDHLPAPSRPPIPDRPVSVTRPGMPPLRLAGRDAQRAEKRPTIDPATREQFQAAKDRMANKTDDPAFKPNPHLKPFVNGVGHVPEE